MVHEVGGSFKASMRVPSCFGTSYSRQRTQMVRAPQEVGLSAFVVVTGERNGVPCRSEIGDDAMDLVAFRRRLHFRLAGKEASFRGGGGTTPVGWGTVASSSKQAVDIHGFVSFNQAGG